MEVAFKGNWGNGRAWYPKGSRECVGFIVKKISDMWDCPKDYVYKRVRRWRGVGDEYKCYYMNNDYKAAKRDRKTLVIPRRWRGPH